MVMAALNEIESGILTKVYPQFRAIIGFKSPIILNLVGPFSLSVVQIYLRFKPSGFPLFISLVTLQLHR